MTSEFSPGYFSGVKVTINNKYVVLESAIGPQSSKAVKSDIMSITIAAGTKFGEAVLQLNGDQKVLASLTTGTTWADKTRNWLMNELNLPSQA